MDTSWTQDLLNWLTANPGWAGFWVFVMSFVESLAFVGILVPGIIILFGIGALISLGAMEFLPIWMLGSLGALVGDVISYAIGRRYRSHLPEMWPGRTASTPTAGATRRAAARRTRRRRRSRPPDSPEAASPNYS